MVIYGLAIICGIFLFCRYRNNFYLYKYLVIYFNFYEILKKILEKFSKIWNKIIINKEKIIIGIIFISIIYIFGYGLKKNIENNTLVNISNYNIIEKSKNIFENIIKLIMLIIIFIVYFGVFYVLDELIYEIWEKLLKKNLLEIIFLILLLFCGINTLNWFKKFNYAFSNLFTEFLFLICIIYTLKITILNISKSKKWILNIGFLVIFFGVIFSSNLNKDFQTGIRITKGELKELEEGSIELFFKNGRKKFNIKSENGELYIENDSLFKNYTIQEFLHNKENNISLFIIPISMVDKKLEYTEIEQGEFLTINNQNLKIKNKNDQIINNNINIDAKIIITSNMNDKNNFTNYIFINNNWYSLQNVTKIKIEKDNFYYNLLNSILFLFGIMYFGLKLYGRKNSTYYDEEIIKEIIKEKKEGKINIILDRNKYDKFLTLSMFGLTIPNILKIVTTKSIGEMNSSIWTKIDIIYIILFSILLFCLITSKEISEYVKELEKENEKK